MFATKKKVWLKGAPFAVTDEVLRSITGKSRTPRPGPNPMLEDEAYEIVTGDPETEALPVRMPVEEGIVMQPNGRITMSIDDVQKLVNKRLEEIAKEQADAAGKGKKNK